MTEKDMENAIRTIAEAFGTDEDPEQAPPSVEQFKGLQNIDPYSLLLIKDDDGKITGWSGLVPTSSKLGDEFVAGRKNENQVIAEAIADPKYEAMYLWAFYMHPDHRRKGDSLRLIEAQFKHIMERHPTIQKYYSWGYSPEGAKKP